MDLRLADLNPDKATDLTKEIMENLTLYTEALMFCYSFDASDRGKEPVMLIVVPSLEDEGKFVATQLLVKHKIYDEPPTSEQLKADFDVDSEQLEEAYERQNVRFNVKRKEKKED